jgi:hypothetical protein
MSVSLAALRLITISNSVGYSTGRSADFSPRIEAHLAIDSAKKAAPPFACTDPAFCARK